DDEDTVRRAYGIVKRTPAKHNSFIHLFIVFIDIQRMLRSSTYIFYKASASSDQIAEFERFSGKPLSEASSQSLQAEAFGPKKLLDAFKKMKVSSSQATPTEI
ncbi:hypothetical protein FOL46_003273, partial [Perkinsus olseni]